MTEWEETFSFEEALLKEDEKKENDIEIDMGLEIDRDLSLKVKCLKLVAFLFEQIFT